MKKLTLHFKRAQRQEGERGPLHAPPPPFSLTTTVAAVDMCSPSDSQEPTKPSSPQTLEEEEEPINPTTLQPDPDQESVEPPEEPDDDQDQDQDQDQDPENPPGMVSPQPSSSAADVSAGTTQDVADATVAPPSNAYHLLQRRPSKRKKGKVNVKKQQAIEKKLQTLLERLNLVPFVPSKILDFAKQEKLLKRLGLWDFVHIEFDRDNMRADLISQLIATYDPKLRCSYVNDFRIAVNRADLARAFKLPVKKEKSGNVVGDGVDLDAEALSEESVGFIEDFVSNWVLLHEDMWIMPVEVLNWTRVIKDGHPEKVDWAGLFWFMVEKELMKGEQLVDCYYASHLQYLIKSQREEVLVSVPEEVVSREEPEKVELDGELEDVVVREETETEKVELDGKLEEVVLMEEPEKVELNGKLEEVVLMEEPEKVEFDEEVKKEDDGGNEKNVKVDGINEVHEEEVNVKVDDVKEVRAEEENDVLVGPNIELTLGQDVGEEEVKGAEMMDVEEFKEDNEQEQEQGQWLLDGKSSMGEHFMQPCNMQDAGGLGSLEERKGEDGEKEEEGVEAEDGFDVVPNDDTLEGNGLTGNFLQAMETTQITFGSQGQLHDQSSVDLLESRNELQHMAASGPSFYINNAKREIDHVHDISDHSLNGGNKRLRVEGPWDHKPMDFGTCMEQMQLLMDRARMMYEEKEQAQEQAVEQSQLNQQILLNELQKRDSMIEHMHKTKCEEVQKRDGEIFRLNRELYLMGSLLDDYRKALKQTDKAFAEYRERCQLPEEPIYKDAGPGGLVLSVGDLEKKRLKVEEEFRMNCSIWEQKFREEEERYILQFGGYLDKVLWLENRLSVLKNDLKELKDSRRRPKISEASDSPPSE